MYVVHCKNEIIIMTYSLSFWLQMSEPITHMDKNNYMTIHHTGACYFDSIAHLMCFVHVMVFHSRYVAVVSLYPSF